MLSLSIRRALARHSQLVLKRAISQTAQDDAFNFRNIALVAHIDSGKTTLTESILVKSSYKPVSGTVDTGSTTTDFLPAERERGITIQSASIPVKWKQWTFNLIDTPGHADFGMEVESASRVVDGAVVLIDSVEGVEAQTEGVWRQLERYNVPSRMIFINKLDRTGASYHHSYLSLLNHRIHPQPIALTLPIASFDCEAYNKAEPGLEGLVDLVRWEIWKWSGDDITRHPLPTSVEDVEQSPLFAKGHPMLSCLAPARIALLENLAMQSDTLMDAIVDLPSASAFLSYPTESILPHLRALTLRHDILPVICGSAMKNIGTELVMDYVGELFASPTDVLTTTASAQPPEPKIEKRSKNQVNSSKALSTKGKLRALAWKVAWDKQKGWMTFVRIYSGCLSRHSTVSNVSRQQKEKVSKLLLLYADQAEEVQELGFGAVGVLLGLKHTRTGDTLVGPGDGSDVSLADIVPPPPVMAASIIPQSHSDLLPIQNALQALARTDPSVRVEVQEGQVLIYGLGALHLEIVEGRLRDEWGVKFETGKRHISYRETVSDSLDSSIASEWTTEVGGQSFTVKFRLRLRQMTADEQATLGWDGNRVLDNAGRPLPSPDASAENESASVHIARGIHSALSTSPTSSLAVSNLFVQVIDAEYPPALPLPLLAGASASVVRNFLQDTGMGPFMEPFVNVKVTFNEEHMGKVVKDLTEHGAELSDVAAGTILAASSEGDEGSYDTEGLYIPPPFLSPSGATNQSSRYTSGSLKRAVYGTCPLSQMLDYSTKLRALSGGHGQFEMVNVGFRVVSEGRKLDILREMGRA